MKTELTKEQRHEVYKLAKEIYIEIPMLVGLCCYIKNAHYLTFKQLVHYKDIELLYPEFYSNKPDCAEPYNHYWWPLGDTASRLKVLDECIKQTE